MFGADPEAKAWAVEQTWNASLHIMGSKSFAAMAPFWPTSTMEFAQPMNQIPKAVFSRQGPDVLKAAGNLPEGALQEGAASWAQAYVASGDLAAEIARLKQGEGPPILAHGGVSFARSLVAGGLVDQFVLGVHPVALGKGRSLFSEIGAPMRLELVSSRAFPGGAVALVYRPGT